MLNTVFPCIAKCFQSAQLLQGFCKFIRAQFGAHLQPHKSSFYKFQKIIPGKISHFQLKFRKVLDVKRELELDERRKNEKLEIPSDHPIRKLLQRMHERHARKC